MYTIYILAVYFRRDVSTCNRLLRVMTVALYSRHTSNECQNASSPIKRSYNRCRIRVHRHALMPVRLVGLPGRQVRDLGLYRISHAPAQCGYCVTIASWLHRSLRSTELRIFCHQCLPRNHPNVGRRPQHGERQENRDLHAKRQTHRYPCRHRSRHCGFTKAKTKLACVSGSWLQWDFRGKFVQQSARRRHSQQTAVGHSLIVVSQG